MYNHITIVGNLTRDPELRTVNTSDGEVSVCNFSVATNDWHQPRRNGEVVPQYFRITVWRDLAERCKKYLTKGRSVLCEGSVSLRRQEVDGVVYTDLEIQNANVRFMQDGRNNAAGGAAQQTSASSAAAPEPNYDAVPGVTTADNALDDDDLPF